MNVLLDAEGDAKLCDFGLAQKMEGPNLLRKGRREGGSARYMAPELHDASLGEITEQVDIWSMGCILIELFSGKMPYWDCTTMEHLTAQMMVARKSPEIPTNLPEAIAALIGRC